MINYDRKTVCGIVDATGLLCSLSWGKSTNHELKFDAWLRFFHEGAKHSLPLAEAIKAYESIGYQAVFFMLAEMPVINTEKATQSPPADN